MADHSLQTLWPLLEKCWQQAEFLSLSLTGPNSTPVDLPRKYLLKPVQIGSEIRVQWTAFDARKRQTHQNHCWQETLALLQQQLGHHYQSAHLKTAREEIQIRLLPAGKLKLKRTPLQQPLPIAQPALHNQPKQYLFPEGVPCPFLIATGIMTDSGQVRQAMYRKFRQINRFAEFVHDMRGHFPTDRPVRIVDYGCGKSYLTFAVRHLLVDVLGRQVDMLGLDTNPEVIASCQQTRDQLEWTDINFQVARIADANLQGPLDLAIWLHACDTATDEALACSVRRSAAENLPGNWSVRNRFIERYCQARGGIDRLI